VLVVVCGDTSFCLEPVLEASVYPAVQNLLLAAHALGLGSALTTLATGFDAELRELLDLPDHVRALAVVPLGHPARTLGPPRREPVAGKTHRDRFGTPWR
jgi:nitroreductase